MWATYPDEEPRRGYTPGDLRMLAIVRLANATFHGRYKWFMYGDDDIYWFMHNVYDILTPFNAEVPYLITDDIGGCCHGGLFRYGNECTVVCGTVRLELENI